MNISKKVVEPKWFDFDKEVKFKIQPFKFSEVNAPDIMKAMLERFKYCLLDWEGLFEEDGKTKLPVNDENKVFLYDYYSDIRNFVVANSNFEEEEPEKKLKKVKN